MKILAKFVTALRLVLRGDWRLLKLQLRVNLAELRLRRAGGRPFIYSDFGFPMICHPDWTDSTRCFGQDDVDEWEATLLRRWLKPGDTAFDFGANLGVYTFAAASAVGPGGRVVAVDADAYVIEKLRLGAQLLCTPQVIPTHSAITEQTGTITFYVRTDRTNTGGQSLKPEEADRAGCTAVTVPASTVPDLLATAQVTAMPALVKVDIEGAEGMMLATAPREWFGAEGPLWIVEVNPFTLNYFGLTARAIVDRFPPAAFECWLLPKHPLDPAQGSRPRPVEAGITFTDARYYNFFAIPRGPGQAQRAQHLRRFFPVAR